ncbi:class I mannose-6-phosphate isomerase [Streptomyces sp. NPDC050164]|uniref:class I mannose-6-phosphate isomerase n=1 Tax=Streptomyces sp. NPDC050164 TaxID=3365605 RepID=UPI0037B16710
MDWYPLRLTTPVKQHVFGGRALAERLGRTGLPDGRVAETWEVSDVDGEGARVADGSLAGRTLRRLVEDHPDELVGRGRRGPRFPVLTKFIDGTGALPVHLHADDDTARRLEDEPHGKTEAWHVLDAAPGACALVGVKAGVDRETLHQALLAQDFDAVMRRLPVRAGQTVYVPGGTLHSFGPGTLVYEIEQTSDIQQHAMRRHMEDGSELDDEEWHTNLGRLQRRCPGHRGVRWPVRAARSGPEPVAAGRAGPCADPGARRRPPRLPARPGAGHPHAPARRGARGRRRGRPR